MKRLSIRLLTTTMFSVAFFFLSNIAKAEEVYRDNHVRFTLIDEGTIRLSVAPEKKKTRILIANSVAQLPSEKPEKLTERFVRGDSARTQKNGGSGIGLAAARRICEKHHGRLTIDYPDGHTFRVKVEL